MRPTIFVFVYNLVFAGIVNLLYFRMDFFGLLALTLVSFLSCVAGAFCIYNHFAKFIHDTKTLYGAVVGVFDVLLAAAQEQQKPPIEKLKTIVLQAIKEADNYLLKKG